MSWTIYQERNVELTLTRNVEETLLFWTLIW